MMMSKLAEWTIVANIFLRQRLSKRKTDIAAIYASRISVAFDKTIVLKLTQAQWECSNVDIGKKAVQGNRIQKEGK